jgi:CheY-like chemotaxis protein/LmbE family N-acetylglucosaminyl deacetylase
LTIPRHGPRTTAGTDAYMPDPSHDEPLPILLVEDDLDQAHLLRFLLEEGGRYRVTLAQDGLKGSEMAARGGWALVITDLNLPGAYGMTVVEASRAAHPETPILATTGYAASDYADQALRRGADEVLLKPLDRDELLARVSVLVRKGGSSPVESETGGDGLPGPTGSGAGTEGAQGGPPLQVLAVGARPGEVEAGVGGTLLRHLDRGDRVMTVVMGPGPEDWGVEETARNRARGASRDLGSRFFMGNARTRDPEEFKDMSFKLLSGALAEIRPDVLYLPTANQVDELSRALVDVALEVAPDIDAVFCYQAGDVTREFDPDLFIPLGEHLDRKVRILETFQAPPSHPIHPDQVTLAARSWARRARGHPAEALEAVHGGEPWKGAATSE